MLEIKNIKKSFGTLEVLKRVSFTVEKGDVVAILGSSGSGKTTLLRCINFLETADEGVMVFDTDTFDMKDISKKQISEIRKKTAFVFQNFNLFSNKTALQNVTEGLIVARKIPKNKAEDIGRQALDKVGLSDRYHHYPHQLSGGQQQRAAIGRALIARPSLILADEPTGNLDTQNSSEVIALLKEASRKYKQTIIMITHNRSIAQTADRVLQVSDGELTDLGRAGDVRGTSAMSGPEWKGGRE